MRAAMVEFEDYFPDCGRKFDGTEKTCSVKEHCNKINHWELKAKIYVVNLSSLKLQTFVIFISVSINTLLSYL